MTEIVAVCTVDLGQRRAEFLRLADSLPPDLTVVAVLRGGTAADPEVIESMPSNTHFLAIGSASLSHARNTGLDFLGSLQLPGDAVIAFPDDDCSWDVALPAVLRAAFADEETMLLIGRYRPWNEPFQPHRYPDEPTPLSARMVLDRCASIVTFTRLRAAVQLRFDETIGVGTALPSGEDTDFALRLMALGGSARYEPSAVCYHRYEKAVDQRRRAVGAYVTARHAYRFPKLAVPLLRFMARRMVEGPDRLSALWLILRGLAHR